MGKRVIRLTESEFRDFVFEATKQVLQEYDGFTYGRISNGSLAARNGLVNNVVTKKVGRKVDPNDPTKRTDEPLRTINNIEKLAKAKELDKNIRADIVNQYKDIVFMFIGTNRHKVDEIFTFQLEAITKTDRDAFIFNGTITWDGQRFNGNVSYLPSKGKCYYTNKRLKINNYELEPIPPTKQAWDNMIQFFEDALTKRKR